MRLLRDILVAVALLFLLGLSMGGCTIRGDFGIDSSGGYGLDGPSFPGRYGFGYSYRDCSFLRLPEERSACEEYNERLRRDVIERIQINAREAGYRTGRYTSINEGELKTVIEGYCPLDRRMATKCELSFREGFSIGRSHRLGDIRQRGY